jgi:hypothetical protein
MTQLYAIRNDGIKFKELDLTSMDIVDTAPEVIPMNDILGFHRNNTAMSTWWVTPETDFIDIDDTSAGAIPDIALWTGGAGSSLVLSPKTYRYLGDLLQSYGEFLPVKVNDEIYYIFNCFILGEADDHKTVQDYVDGKAFGLKHIEFKESVKKHLLFKSTVDGCTTLFCGDQFKEIAESFEINGIIFDTNLVEAFE